MPITSIIPITGDLTNSVQFSVLDEVNYEFADPCPAEMREVGRLKIFSFQLCCAQVNMSDLSGVTIDWKMLTVARPNNKIDEQFFAK